MTRVDTAGTAASRRRSATPEPVRPLEGFTVAVTAARRRDELATLLERRGARVVQAPAIRIVPLEDDTELLAATWECVEHPPDIAVATTGIGFRGWMEAADGWGLGDDLRERLAGATLLARGPKARGAIRAAGLTDDWSPESESSAEVLSYLLSGGVSGQRVAVQLHGEPLPELADALREAGAEMVAVPVYRWVLPEDVAPLARLVEAIAERQIDCVTFTSAPAVASLLTVAGELGLGSEVEEALRDDVLPVCVGPVTAGRLAAMDVPTVQPKRARLGAMVREIVSELPARCRTLRAGGHEIEVRGHAVIVDGHTRELAPGPMAVMDALAKRPGAVVPRSRLLAILPGGGSNEHAVEMAVTRLRGSVGSGVVQTVVKRGYRLACADVPTQ